jgi:hypothetical protein
MRWAIVALVVATGCSTNTPTTTTAESAPLAALVLAADGLGDLQLGVGPDVAVADISALFGEPDHDSAWIPSQPNIYGSCPGETMRAIGWGSLVAIFIDDGEGDLGGWFFTYTYGYDYSENTGGVDPRDLGLTTAEGIGLGSTVASLRTAFPDGLTVGGDEELDVWYFTAETAGLRGLLTGASETATVTLIEPIAGCD